MDSQNLSQGSSNGGQKSSSRYYFFMVLLGVFSTTTIASVLAPGLIKWWYDSPAPTPISAACVPAIDWAIRMLQMIQLSSIILGAVLGLLIAYRFRSR